MAGGRNYVRKGDTFSDLVRQGKGPPTVIHWLNRSTGRTYFTRVPVHCCTTIKATDAAAKLRAMPETHLSQNRQPSRPVAC